jgi:hypothetical protein
MQKKINIPIFIKSNDKQILNKAYNIWISSLVEEGVAFFSLTIRLVEIYVNNPKEIFINNTKIANKEILKILERFSRIEFIDCIYGSFEVTNKNIPYLSLIIGFRSHYNSIDFIKIKIMEILYASNRSNFKLIYIKKFFNIIKVLQHLSKNFFKTQDPIIFFATYSNVNKDAHSMIVDSVANGRIECLKITYYSNQLVHNDIKIENEIPLGLLSNIKSIPKKVQNNLNLEILYYFDIYFSLFDIIVDINDNLYQKIENSTFSYEYIGNIDNFILKNHHLIFQKIKKSVFEFLNLSALTFIFSKSSEKLIKQFKIFFNYEKKQLNFNLIEFLDGIYFVDLNIKKKKEECIDISQPLYILHFFNRAYEDLFKFSNYPQIWKTKLLHNFTEDEFISFCKNFRVMLFGNLETELKILFLLDVSNSFKSQLILDMIIKFYGFQNISFSSIDEKLKFENFNNELKFSQEMVDLLKNLSFGKILTIRLDSKSLKSPTSLKYIIITSNYNKRVLRLLDKNSLKSRINKFTIIDNCTLTNKEINDFEKELPQILVYCNKIFFNNKNN